MKISNPQTNISAGVEKTTSAFSGTSSSVAQNATSASPDGVQLSSLGQYFAAANNISQSHVEKLSALGGAISAGQYNVDAFTVSGSLIQYSMQAHGA